ncbi:hypothetical protein AAW50_03620 [Mycoplasmopsis canis]|uniref:hypothetical protein n=1 Tax=Mycoplasmopsis canis TaxID=29555 RepID=UPI000624DC6B|nr:hypothetical protein [Mycoplasmopsis canis]AKF41477.1 hypothetical protein AAW50_03620 [Mycoplasmopsis canis]
MKRTKLLNKDLIKTQEEFYTEYINTYIDKSKQTISSAILFFIKDHKIDIDNINKKIRESIANKTIASRTLHVYITILKTYIKESNKFFNLNIDENDIDYIKAPSKSLKTAYTEKQVEIIKKELKNNDDELLEFWVNFIAFNGCRPVEAEQALKTANWFIEQQYNTYITKHLAAKNNHERILMIPPEFKNFFESNLENLKNTTKNLNSMLSKRWERFYKAKIETNEFWDRDTRLSKDIYTFRHTWFTKGSKKGYASNELMIASGHRNAATIDDNYINRDTETALRVLVGVNERDILENKDKNIIQNQNKQLKTAIEQAAKIEKEKNDLIDMLKEQNLNLEKEIKIVKNELDKNNNNFKEFCEFVEKTTNIDLTNLYSIFTEKGVLDVK